MKLHFEAKKHSYRQTQDGVVVSFVMHPNEVDPEFAASPLGTRFMVALAEIGEDEQPTERVVRYADGSLTRELEPSITRGLRDAVAYAEGDASRGRESEPKAKSEGERAVIRAVMLAKDPAFQKWANMGNGGPDDDPGLGERDAREYIIRYCRVTSRAELKDNVDARMKLYRLITRFESETGRMAEVRS